MLLLFGLGACGKQAHPAGDPQKTGAAQSTSLAVAQAMTGSKAAAMHSIPVPKDKAQLDRMLAMGYTVHEDHMHPPGVKECPLDKAGASVVQ
jgi:hypothetical protein